MDKDNHWCMYFKNVEMCSTNDMNPDVVGVDFPLIIIIIKYYDFYCVILYNYLHLFYYNINIKITIIINYIKV